MYDPPGREERGPVAVVARVQLSRHAVEAVAAHGAPVEGRIGRHVRLDSGDLAAQLGQKVAYLLLRLGVCALAEVAVPYPPFAVDQVLGRPVDVAEGVPRHVVVVLRDRVLDPVLGYGGEDVVPVLLERELGGVDADDDQPAVSVLVVPLLEVRERPDAVDARVGPEVDEHHLAALAGYGERLGVDPGADASKLRSGVELLLPGGDGRCRLGSRRRGLRGRRGGGRRHGGLPSDAGGGREDERGGDVR